MKNPKLKQYGKLQSLIHSVRRFYPAIPEGAPDPLAPIIETLIENNWHNMEAQLPVVNFDFDDIHLPDYEAYEDYEPGGDYYNCHTDETCPVDDIDEKKEEAQEALDKLEEELAVIVATMELLEEEDKMDTDEYTEWEAKCNAAETARDEAQEVYDGWDDAEIKQDELMWNTAWSENGCVNVSLARYLGLDTLEFVNDEKSGDCYFSLGGIGMDMSPLLSAYVILEHGFCAEQYASHFESASRFDYFKHVAHTEVAVKCLEKLEVLDIALYNKYFTEEEIDRYKLTERLATMDNSDTI